MEARSSLRAALVDFDGTLVDLPVDWERLREEISRVFAGYGVTRELRPLYASLAQAFAELEARGVAGGRRGNVRRKINGLMTEAELRAVATAKALPGSRELLECLRGRGMKTMIQTSNSVRAVHEVWERLAMPPVDAVIGRESARRPKPHPEGVRRALRRMGLRGAETVVIGDGDFDVALGRAIGATTVRVGSRHPEQTAAATADIEVATLHELIGLLESRRELTGAAI